MLERSTHRVGSLANTADVMVGGRIRLRGDAQSVLS